MRRYHKENSKNILKLIMEAMKSDYVSPLSVADNMRVLNVSVFPPSLCIYLFLFQLFKSFRIHNQMRLAELGNSDKYFSFSSPE